KSLVLIAPLRSLMASDQSDLRGEAMKLAGAWKMETLRADIQNQALDDKGREQDRRAAIESLASFGPAARDTLRQLAGTNTPAISSAAIAALTAIDLPEAAARAAELFKLSPADLDETRTAEVFTAFL